ncbi:MAG: hypothetical protein ACU0DW_13115 [Shimia sp.]
MTSIILLIALVGQPASDLPLAPAPAAHILFELPTTAPDRGWLD